MISSGRIGIADASAMTALRQRVNGARTHFLRGAVPHRSGGFSWIEAARYPTLADPMCPTLRVDVAAVDPTQFKVIEQDGETLVIPRKDKFRWDESELHLRSLVLDAGGHVLSAGFPKFFNLGENPAHDRSLAEGMAGGTVEFPEKIDGSLIVADRIRGVARLRTRGRRDLGEFAPEVEPLVARLYPRLIEFLHDDPLLDEHSLVFELVSPTRAVVLKYDVAQLHLLGAVSKRTITPRWDAPMLAYLTGATEIEAAPIHPLPPDLDAALEQVRGWKGREGVVGRFLAADGAPRLIKIKAADYLRLHAYRSLLGGAGALKIAWLLDLHEASEIVPALARYGLDWEAAQFARAEVEPYLERRRAMLSRFTAFRGVVTPWLGARQKSEKRAYVESVRALMASDALFREPFWFTAAMKLFDTEVDTGEAQIIVDSAVIDQHASTLLAWRRDPDAEIRSTLTAPVREDDG